MKSKKRKSEKKENKDSKKAYQKKDKGNKVNFYELADNVSSTSGTISMYAQDAKEKRKAAAKAAAAGVQVRVRQRVPWCRCFSSFSSFEGYLRLTFVRRHDSSKRVFHQEVRPGLDLTFGTPLQNFKRLRGLAKAQNTHVRTSYTIHTCTL